MKEQEVDSINSNGDIINEATELVEAKMKLEYNLNGITDQETINSKFIFLICICVIGCTLKIAYNLIVLYFE